MYSTSTGKRKYHVSLSGGEAIALDGDLKRNHSSEKKNRSSSEESYQNRYSRYPSPKRRKYNSEAISADDELKRKHSSEKKKRSSSEESHQKRYSSTKKRKSTSSSKEDSKKKYSSRGRKNRYRYLSGRRKKHREYDISSEESSHSSGRYSSGRRKHREYDTSSEESSHSSGRYSSGRRKHREYDTSSEESSHSSGRYSSGRRKHREYDSSSEESSLSGDHYISEWDKSSQLVVSYIVEPNKECRERLTAKGKRTLSQGKKKEELLFMEVSVDTHTPEGYKQKFKGGKTCPNISQLKNYCRNLVELKGLDPSIVTIHFFDPSRRQVMIDKYDYSLGDLLKQRRRSCFLKPKNGLFTFSNRFRVTIKAIVNGLTILHKHRKTYSDLSVDTIVFSEEDEQLKNPKLVDFFQKGEGRNWKAIWSSFAKVIETIVEAFNVQGKIAGDLELFIQHLQSPKEIYAKGLAHHPAILRRGDRLKKVIHIRHHCMDKLNVDGEFETVVCGNVDWKDVVAYDGYFQLMLNDNPLLHRGQVFARYNSDLNGLVFLFRNMAYHLDDNLKATQSQLTSKSFFEIEAMMERYFPKLLGYLFSNCKTKHWVE